MNVRKGRRGKGKGGWGLEGDHTHLNLTHLFAQVSQVAQQVAMRNVLDDKAQRWIQRAASEHRHDVLVLAHRLHEADLRSEIRHFFFVSVFCWGKQNLVSTARRLSVFFFE